MKRRLRKKRKLKKTVMLFVFIVLIFWTVYWLYAKVYPVIKNFASIQGKILAGIALNEGASTALEQNAFSYHDFIKMQQDEDGNVKGLYIDTVKIEQIQETILKAVNTELSKLSQEQVCIPLGTVLGSRLMNGCGPDITFQITPVSYAQGQIFTRVENCGINQIHHSVWMNFQIEMLIYTFGASTKIYIEDDVFLADTIYSGEIPQWYKEESIPHGDSAHIHK